ncbi:MAG TPA: DNA repair protein RadC [Patescibacteria group bacterium]|nr:DNA repair protein RadC [Patescibacteria group bacterium]
MGTIKDLPNIERPREKLTRYGPEKLSHAELLALILRSGQKKLNAVELSKRILNTFGKEGLIGVTKTELLNTFGMGDAKASALIACFELGRRFLQNKQSSLLLSPKDVWSELKDVRDNKKEHFIIFFLDARNQEIKREIISIGSLNASIVHPREVFEPAVRYLTAQIIVSHNHPSGNTEPSEDDLLMTKRLVESGKILGIELVDHIIVSKNGFLSFKEKKLI